MSHSQFLRFMSLQKLFSAISIGISVCFFASLAFAKPPTIHIDSHQDGESVGEDHVVITGSATACGGGHGIDLLLVLDDSSSLEWTDPAVTRFDAVRELLNSFSPQSNLRIGLAFFSSTGMEVLAVPLGELDTAQVAINQEMLNRPVPNGGTAIGNGIRLAMSELETHGRPEASRVMVVFTDGEDGGSDPVGAATEATSKDIIVNVVGLGDDAINPTNQAIADTGSGVLLTTDQPAQLASLFSTSKLVCIDTIEVANETTGEEATPTISTGIFTAVLGLIPGDNLIKASATNPDGETASTSMKIIGGIGGVPPPPSCSTRQVRSRPQVIMVGFDPILVDPSDAYADVIAIVREGSVPIHQVSIDPIPANGTRYLGMGIPMEQTGTLANGDQVWRYRIPTPSQILIPPGAKATDLFGINVGQYVITVLDHGNNLHSFPNLEFGNNASLFTTPGNESTTASYGHQGPTRSGPQVLAGGFDPALVDFSDNFFNIKAIVRPGSAPIESVTLRNNAGNVVAPLTEEKTLNNGDKLYCFTFSYNRGGMSTGVLKNLFGSAAPQFIIEAVDSNGASHQFPSLTGGNFVE